MLRVTHFGLLKLAFSLLEEKTIYLALTLLSKFPHLFISLAIATQSYYWYLIIPLLEIGFQKLIHPWKVRAGSQVKLAWSRQCLTRFYAANYPSRKNTLMTDFQSQVEKTGWIMKRLLNWGFATLIKLVIIIINILITIFYHGYYQLLLMFPVMGLFYWLRVSPKQEGLTEIRKKKKELQKKIKPVSFWNLHLFQNRKKSVSELMENEQKIMTTDNQFIMEWDAIATEMSLMAQFLTCTAVYLISPDWNSLLANYAIFYQLTICVINLGHFANNMANNIKDFDRFSDLMEKLEIEQQVLSNRITFPLLITQIRVRIGDLLLEGSELHVTGNDKILLRGPSGIGKTVLVNALQGLIPGAEFQSLTPKSIQQSWEYMNQQTRECIPTTGLTLRQMLEGESDTGLILRLVEVVLLSDKFNVDNLDDPMNSLSGGEKMRLSILYTLWNYMKRNKSIMILDEPEQGLDEDIRVQLIQNILRMPYPVLLIYHGSRLDLMSLPFTQCWDFQPTQIPQAKKHTRVTPYAWADYREQVKEDILREISRL